MRTVRRWLALSGQFQGRSGIEVSRLPDDRLLLRDDSVWPQQLITVQRLDCRDYLKLGDPVTVNGLKGTIFAIDHFQVQVAHPETSERPAGVTFAPIKDVRWQ